MRGARVVPRLGWFGIGVMWSVLLHAAITVQIEPSMVRLGETVRLTLTMDGSSSAGVPDLLPLEHDFRLIGTEQSMSYSVVNGQAHSLRQWSVVLAPKHPGLQVIPPLHVGKQWTQATQVTVTAAPVSASSTSKNRAQAREALFFVTEMTPKKPYLHQQVLYTVQLWHRVRFFNAEYRPPHVEDALLLPLGSTRQYQADRDGERYWVEAQRYAVFPQKSGALLVHGPSLDALVEESGLQPTHLASATKSLWVQPPLTQRASWFPAEQIRLTEKASANILKTGEVLIRNLTLKAQAVPAALLPKLAFHHGDGWRVYPEKPITDNVMREQTLEGRAHIKATYVFDKPGTYTLPDLRLPWFNTLTGKAEVAVLPARSVRVEGAAIPDSTPPSQPVLHKTQRMSSSAVASKKPVWYAVMGVAWIVTLLGCWWLQPWLQKKHHQRGVLKQLRRACEQNQALQARDACMQWAARVLPQQPMRSVQDLMDAVDDATFKQQLHALSQALYHPHAGATWKGDVLWQCVKSFKKTKKSKPKANPLPPLT